MNLTRDRIHTIGWGTALALSLAFTAGVSARVSAEKSKAALAERQIESLHQDIGYLQTEFETRANQQALKQLNDTEFGYEAPTAGQYLEGERQLAALSKPADPGAPPPVRFANAGDDAMPTPAPEHLAAVMAGDIAPGKAVLVKTALRERLSHLGAGGIASE